MWWPDRRRRKTITYLDRLALALVDAQWASVTRYDERPPLLRVFDARAPLVGESITAVRGWGGWYYRSSMGSPLADCADLTVAVWQIDRLLGPVVMAMLNEDGR